MNRICTLRRHFRSPDILSYSLEDPRESVGQTMTVFDGYSHIFLCIDVERKEIDDGYIYICHMGDGRTLPFVSKEKAELYIGDWLADMTDRYNIEYDGVIEEVLEARDRN